MADTCLACLRPTCTAVAETLEDSSIRQCAVCGLQYVAPVPADVPVFADFAEDGLALLSNLANGAANGASIDFAITPNERAVLRWLQRHVPRSAPVLELCCESGRFLAALRSRGFSPFGMDPLPSHAAMLRTMGFSVRLGHVEDCPAEWPEPAAVIILESLVRFPDPVSLLQAVHKRFPRALLCLSVPSPRRSLKVPEFDRRLDYPPHHLTRWTPKALTTAMKNAGYRGACRLAHVDLKWRREPWERKILKILFGAFLRIAGESEYSIVAIGRPT